MYHVLICEDEPLIGLGLQKIIREFNFPVQKIDYFENSLEAYQYIQKNAVDIIITDIQMPHLNGLDFIQKVKRMYPDMQCIILSGYSDFSYAQSAIKLGVVDYLLKPIDKGELQKLLETCMERIGEIKKTEFHDLQPFAASLGRGRFGIPARFLICPALPGDILCCGSYPLVRCLPKQFLHH